MLQLHQYSNNFQLTSYWNCMVVASCRWDV